MAQDDKEPHGSVPGATEPGNQAPIYETFNGSRTPERFQQAGGKEGEIPPQRPPKPTLGEAVQSIKPDDFLKVHQTPCAREGLMTGIGAGVVVGAGRYITGAKIPKAANWACGAFLLGSIIQFEYCLVQRRKERVALARVVEVMDRKQAEKKARAEEAVRLKRKAEEKARQDQQRWYKFW